MLRRVLAERLSGLERAGAERPIASVVAVPATRLTAQLRERVSVCYGTAYGETAGQWYHVTYPKVVKGAVPVCVAEGRTGAITRREISKVPDVGAISKLPDVTGIPLIPDIVLPTVTIPKVGIRTWHCKSCGTGYFSIISMTKCPRCGSYNTEELTTSDRYEKTGWFLALWNAKKQLGDWSLLNWARDAIATVLAWFGYYLFSGNSSFVLADALSTQTDKVRDGVQSAINSIIGDLRSKLSTHVSNINARISDVNSRLSTLVSGINTRISDVNSRLKSQIDYVTDAVNLRLDDLYAIWGIPSNMAVTPVHVRNCADAGFDFQSFGKTKIHFIAVGELPALR